MLLTAQRVRSPRQAGVNVFFFHHGAEESAKIDWSSPNIDEIASGRPGQLVSETIEVIPGGNSVESFLDVVAPDGTSKEAIVAMLRSPELLEASEQGRAVVRAPLAARLHAERLPREARNAELRTLRDKLALLLAHPRPPPWHSLKPLVVLARRESDGWRYLPEAESVARIRGLLGRDWTPPKSVGLSDDVQQQFEVAHGDALPHLLPALLDLSAEGALQLGGVRVVGTGGEVIAEWPESVGPGTGYCLKCHQHHTLIQQDSGDLKCSNCENVQGNDGLWVATLT